MNLPAVPEPDPAAPPAVQGGPNSLADWVTAAADAQSLARQLITSFFVPATYKPQTRDGVEQALANATGAILLGQALGLDPLTSLQQIYVVHGRPGLYSKMKVAIAQREGHRIWEEESSPTSVTWCGQRRGTEDVVRVTVTLEDAKRAGWTSNAAYAKTPADMLAARASSRVVDRIAGDALFGLSSVEDLEDVEPVAVTARVSASDLVGPRKALPNGEPAPAAAEAVPDPEPEPEPDVVTPAQLRKMGACMGDLGVKDRGDRLNVTGHIVGRVIGSAKDLSKNEASRLIDALEAEGAAELVAEVLGWNTETAPVEVEDLPAGFEFGDPA